MRGRLYTGLGELLRQRGFDDGLWRLLRGGRLRIVDRRRGRVEYRTWWGPLGEGSVERGGARIGRGVGRAVRDIGRLTTLAHVRPTEVEFMAEGLVHSHDTLKQRVRLGTMEGLGKLERALGREIVGGGRERRFKR